MADDKITLSISTMFIIALVALAALGFVFQGFFFSNASYALVLPIAALIIWSALYIYSKSEHLNEMCCMMNGMGFGMITSFYIGTLLAVPGADFILSFIVSTIAGMIIGILLGRQGGPLGRMEGIMAAPMGGAMGAMTGVMVRVYDYQLFIEFFMLVFVFIMYEITKMNYHHAEKHISKGMLYAGIGLSVLLLLITFSTHFTLGATVNQINTPAVNAAPSDNGSAQVVNMHITAAGYDPSTFTVKKGIPVQINMQADTNAGCDRAIVFPDFNIQKTVAAGGTGTITFTPTTAGTFNFHCSMGMVWGKMIVTE